MELGGSPATPLAGQGDETLRFAAPRAESRDYSGHSIVLNSTPFRKLLNKLITPIIRSIPIAGSVYGAATQIIGGNGDSLFRRLMRTAGRPDMAEDPELKDNAGRLRHQERVDGAIADHA